MKFLRGADPTDRRDWRARPVNSPVDFTDETLPPQPPVRLSPGEKFTVEIDTDEHFGATAVRIGRTDLPVQPTCEFTGPPPVTGRASERKVPGQF